MVTCVITLILVMITGFYRFVHTYHARKQIGGVNQNMQVTGWGNESHVFHMQRSRGANSPTANTWVFIVLYSGDYESAQRAETSWFLQRPGIGRAAFGFYGNTTVECRSHGTHRGVFHDTRQAFLQAARCFPEARFFARLNLENGAEMQRHMRYVEELGGNASDYVGLPVESDGLVFASVQAGYVLSRDSVRRLESCAPSPQWSGLEDSGVGECMQKAGVGLTYLPSDPAPAGPTPDLCVVITFPESADPLKRLAHQNTASMYRSLRPRVRAFLAQPVPRDAEWDLGILDAPASNEHGTPLFGSLLLRAKDACPDTPLIAYANSDILFDAGLVETVDALLAWDQPEFLAVGRRRNHELKGALATGDVSTAQSELFLEVAQDYFILSRRLVDQLSGLPPYVIGRRAYDNAINDWAFHQSILVDLTETVTALHQTTSDGNFAGHSEGNPDKEYNVLLPGAVYDHGSTMHAQYATVKRDGKVVVLRKSDSTVVSSQYRLRLTRRGKPVELEELPSPLLVVFGNAAYKEMLANFLCNTFLFPPMHAHTLVIVTDQETMGYMEALDSDATIGLFQHPMQSGHDFDTQDYVKLMLLRGRLLLSLLGERVVLWMEADAEYSGNLLEHPAVTGATTDLVLYWDGTSYGGGFVRFAATQAALGFYARVVQRLEAGIERGDFTNDQVLLNDELSLQPSVSRTEFDRCEFRNGRFYHKEFRTQYAEMCAGTRPVVQQHNWVVGNQNKIDMAKEHGAWHLTDTASRPRCRQRDMRVLVMTMNRPASLARLLSSLQSARYPPGAKIDLRVTVDRQAGQLPEAETMKVLQAFQWSHGLFETHAWPDSVGIFGQWVDAWQCELFPEYLYGAVVLLEDDLEVSPAYFEWFTNAHRVYASTQLGAVTGMRVQLVAQSGTQIGVSELIPPETNVFAYSLIATWSMSPTYSAWKGFRSWVKDIRTKQEFDPAIEGTVPGEWYKQFKAAGAEAFMWEIWFMRFMHDHNLYTLYPWINQGQETIVCNWREPGLHYTGMADRDFTLVQSLPSTLFSQTSVPYVSWGMDFSQAFSTPSHGQSYTLQQYKDKCKWIETTLAAKGLSVIEGFSAQLEIQVYEYQKLFSMPNITSIAEIGFNMGHSTLLMLMSNPSVEIQSFDLGQYDYARAAFRLLKEEYPQRKLDIVWGDSTITVPAFHSQNPEKKFDVLIVDGGHSYEVATKDVLNMKKLSHPDTIVIIDDTPCNAPYCINKVISEQEASGLIQVDKVFSVDQNRGFLFASYIKTLKIHFIWVQPYLGDEISNEKEEQVERMASRWTNGVKKSKLYFWTRQKITQEFPELVSLLELIPTPAWISDIVRYQVLNKFGGLYLDTDVHFLQSPVPLLEQHNYTFSVCQTPWSDLESPDVSECESVINAIIASPPLHPAVTCAAETSVQNTLKSLERQKGMVPSYNVYETGPTIWSQCIHKHPMSILPSRTFLPCPCCDGCNPEKYQGVKGVYGMHEWDHSWW